VHVCDIFTVKTLANGKLMQAYIESLIGLVSTGSKLLTFLDRSPFISDRIVLSVILCHVCSMKLGQRAGSPKFVVTFDGADESLSEMDAIDADTLLARSSVSARNVVRVKPQTQALARLEEGSCNYIALISS